MGKVAVVGAGSWGTAIAQALARSGSEVMLWAYEEEVVQGINGSHRNPLYLTEARLADGIGATGSLEECVRGAVAAAIVTPSSLLRSFADRLAPLLPDDMPVIICSKGVEEDTGLVGVQIFEEVIGHGERLAALSGPTHAEEVVCDVPTAAVSASASPETAVFFRDLFSSKNFRCYTASDCVGVELCAAFKNIVAIAVGAAYGAGYGDNTAAMLMSRGMAEMSRLVRACGGDGLTVMGLAGAGDLIVTCTSEHSRNRTFGKALSQGETLKSYEDRTHMVVEGAVACRTIFQLAQRLDVELPIANAVFDLVWNGADISALGDSLLERPLTTEFWGFGESPC